MREGSEPEILERCHGEEQDLRYDEEVAYQINAFLREHQVLSVSLVDRIIGCPHEEIVDYPEREACPHCPYWSGRDRCSGELIH